jgi:hypothetical protein
MRALARVLSLVPSPRWRHRAPDRPVIALVLRPRVYVHASEPDPGEEAQIDYARQLIAASAPLLEDERKMSSRELWYAALELARCVRDLLVIIGDTRS